MVDKNAGLYDVEMEKFVLSALLMRNGEAVPVATAVLKAEDFYRPAHRKLYRAIVRLYDAGEPPNVLTLVTELQKAGELSDVGIELVYSLAEYANTTAYVESYARTIKEKSQLRALMRIGEEIAQAAYEAKSTAAEILSEAEQKLCGLYVERRGEFEALSTIVTRTVKEIGEQVDGAKFTGVPSGFTDLDELTNGFQRADLILLAARPSMGKTALALNVAVNAALSGKSVAVFSFEMSKGALARRLLVMQARVDSAKVQNGTLTAAEFSDLIEAADELSRLKVYISDAAETSAAGLRSAARRQKLENDVELIIVDYLQLMTGGKAENRQQEISAISRSLKALARELDVPIIALSQLSRNAELRADKRPLLSDLRESGALEQDADIVMFLYREDYYDAEAAPNVAELIIAKNRNGATRRLKLYFDRSTQRFEALEG